MLQCVGPWDESGSETEFYCSRICCSVAAKNALRLKELNPTAQIFVLYNRDIRTYGFQESLYTQAREAGIVFLRYEEGTKPEIGFSSLSPAVNAGAGLSRERSTEGSPHSNGPVEITVRDRVLGQPVALNADRVVLSEAMVPAQGSRDLAELFKFSCTLEGFFLEAHVKLQPVDFPAEGIYLAGAAHYPKLLEETIAQAGAAAARAASILSKDHLEVGGVVAQVDPAKCTACLTCVRICPFGAVGINAEQSGVGRILGAAEVTAAACRGCGLCAAECPAKAIQLQHFTDDQILSKEEALFAAMDRALVA
jgi:heterodisulfide reductase subunit A-like polyferredoxin